MMLITGTLVNVSTVVVGSILGVLLGNRIPERIRHIFFQGIGLFTLFLGVSMSLKTGNPLVLVLALISGGLIGEWLYLEERMESFTRKVKNLAGARGDHFSEGLITAFLLFCMGSMTILGAMEEGLGGRPDLLLTKSIMDGLSAIALTAALGIGVLFSVIPLFLYQGGLTVVASFLAPLLTDYIINEITATGGIILLGLGLQILEIKRFRVVNFIPALLMAVFFAWLFYRTGLY